MNFRRILLSIATLILCFQAFAATPYSYKGKTDSKIMGKEEVLENMILNVTETSDGLSASLKDYQLMGRKGVSISGILKVNDKGEVIGFDNIVIKGGPAKVKNITGYVTKDKADLDITGKAVGTLNFDVHYTGDISK